MVVLKPTGRAGKAMAPRGDLLYPQDRLGLSQDHGGNQPAVMPWG